MLVTAPFVLLLLDYWPLGRMDVQSSRSKLQSLGWLLIEKWPFFLLTAGSCGITYLAQQGGGAVETLEHIPVEGRLANALAAYAAYLGKMLWPAKLAILYLRPDVWPLWQLTLSAVVLAVVTVYALKWATKRPWFLVGWFWYVGMLVPVIGLVQVGNQYMADRYSYLPLIGCFIILAWGGGELAQRLELKRQLVAGFAALILVALAAQTLRQARYWQNTETLFGHCLSVTKSNFVAHNILGAWLARNNRFDEAKSHFLAALQIAPEHADSLNNIGVLLAQHGETEEALGYLRQAMQLKSGQANVFGKLAWALDAEGKTERAIIFYREALRVEPDNAQLCNNLAWLLATTADAKFRNGAEAAERAEHACSLASFNQAPLLGTLAAAYAEAGRFQDAVATAEKAIDLAQAAGQKELCERNRQLLELYRAGKPFHDEVAPK
jgi:tetratricopeptide (TPR) repeat protein